MNPVLNIYERCVGNPWVYDRLRPIFFGGFDFTSIYGWLGDTEHDVILDVGCGTGAALQYLKSFRAYHGFDTDERALRRFRQLHAQENVHLYHEMLSTAQIKRLRPDKVLMMGLLHHLPDSAARELLAMLGQGDSIQRIVTLDILYVPGRPVNNLITWLDRGRYGRKAEQYLQLLESCPFHASKTQLVESGNRISVFYCMCLNRK
jgi:SAM-dependent methyltransferase